SVQVQRLSRQTQRDTDRSQDVAVAELPAGCANRHQRMKPGGRRLVVCNLHGWTATGGLQFAGGRCHLLLKHSISATRVDESSTSSARRRLPGMYTPQSTRRLICAASRPGKPGASRLGLNTTMKRPTPGERFPSLNGGASIDQLAAVSPAA